MSKARVTPTTPTVLSPRTKLRGILLLARAITVILPGFSRLPNRISLFRDSHCTISTVECDQKLLKVWLGNPVAEIHDHMHSWRGMNIMVDKLYHWPGESNEAVLPTRGKAWLH